MNFAQTIKTLLACFLFCLSINSYSQYGIIEMKNGDKHEMAMSELRVEKDQLRYFVEKWERKTLGIGGSAKKLRQEYEEKSRLVNIEDIKRIHVTGQLTYKDEPLEDVIGIKYIKLKRRYEAYYIVVDGPCQLLMKGEDGNAWYSYFVQTGDEEPFQIHRSGTVFGAKFRKKSKKYFAECGPAMVYIEEDLGRWTLSELVEIYNLNCAN